MSNISTVISELLFERESIIVPGLGMFVRHDDGAKVNVITNQFERPTATISFDPQQRGEDGFLVKALAAYESCPEEEAQRTLTQFVAESFAALKEGKEVAIEGVGILRMGDHAQVSFTPEEGANLNADAFGLDDFAAVPVYDGQKTEDWKAQVAQQTKDLNTPMTVDRQALDEGKRKRKEEPNDEYEFNRHRRRSILWTILSLLLVIPVVLILLYFLEIIHIDLPIKPKPQPIPKVVFKPNPAVLSQMVQYYPAATDIASLRDAEERETAPVTDIASPGGDADTLVGDTVAPKGPAGDVDALEGRQNAAGDVIPPTPPTPKINIIGGFFSQQENAEKLVNTLHGQGYAKAFVMKRGQGFYVSYGSFEDLESANAELTKIHQNSNAKAWIMNK